MPDPIQVERVRREVVEVLREFASLAHDTWPPDYDAAADAILRLLAPSSERTPSDDARHITWDHGRRTLCGQRVSGDPGDFYLPLGKAPRTDEGGAWCWSCLQLQDEATASASSEQEGENEAKNRIDHELHRHDRPPPEPSPRASEREGWGGCRIVRDGRMPRDAVMVPVAAAALRKLEHAAVGASDDGYALYFYDSPSCAVEVRRVAGYPTPEAASDSVWMVRAQAALDAIARADHTEAGPGGDGYEEDVVEAMLETAHDHGRDAQRAIERGEIEPEDQDALPLTVERACYLAGELLGKDVTARALASSEAQPGERVVAERVLALANRRGAVSDAALLSQIRGLCNETLGARSTSGAPDGQS